MASALTIPRMRVVVIHNTKVPVTGDGCSKVMVHISGEWRGGRGMEPHVNAVVVAMWCPTTRSRCDRHQKRKTKIQVSIYKYSVPSLIPRFYFSITSITLISQLLL